MAVEIPTTEPAVVYAGFTLQWKKSLSDYPASEYTLKYAIRGPQQIDLTATADGNDHLVSIAAADTEIYEPGDYWWYSFVEKGSGNDFERYKVADGKLIIKADPEALDVDHDGRSHAKVMLDAIEATLQGKATDSQLDLLQKSIGDKNLQRNPELLMRWRNYYRAEYLNEVNAASADLGTYKNGKIRVRFTEPI